MHTPDEFIDEIQRIRAANNGAWMDLVRLAWRVAPSEAREISKRIVANDEAILKLSKAMADEEPEYVRWARRAEAGGIDE